MTFGLGGPFGNTAVSVTKMNKTSVLSGPGADFASLNAIDIELIKCTTTGGGYTQNHFYTYDETSGNPGSLTDISGSGTHNHSSSATGGTLLDIYEGNPLLIDSAGYLLMHADVAKWVTSHTSTANEANDTDGTTSERSIKLTTGTTSGSRASITQQGLEMDFAKPAMLQSKSRIETLSSLNLRVGFHPDNVSSADSNNVNCAFEVCTATNNNWAARTASGSNKSAEDTGIAATTNRTGLKIVHHPTAGTPVTLFYVDTNTVYQKTTFIPVSGGSGNANICRYSLKNSTTADRPWYAYNTRIRYTTLDKWV